MDRTLRFAIFDLDDTLYDESRYVESGFQAVADYMQQHFGVDANLVILFCRDIFKKEGRGKVFDYLLPMLGIERQVNIVHMLVDVYHNHPPLIKPLPGVKQLLTSLNQKKVSCLLVTDTRYAVQKCKLEALALAPFFNAILFTDEHGWEKPASAIYDYLEKRCGVQWSEAIVVGDDPMRDFVEAKKRGAYTVRMRIPGLRLAHLTSDSLHEAHKEFDSFQKFLEWFRINFGN